MFFMYLYAESTAGTKNFNTKVVNFFFFGGGGDYFMTSSNEEQNCVGASWAS